jgi:hypothetical protein
VFYCHWDSDWWLTDKWCSGFCMSFATNESRGSSGWTIGVLGFDSRRELGIFLFTTASRTGLGPTQPTIQWVTTDTSLGIRRPGREVDHSPPSSAEVKNVRTRCFVCVHWTLPFYVKYVYLVYTGFRDMTHFSSSGDWLSYFSRVLLDVSENGRDLTRNTLNINCMLSSGG